MKNKKANIIFLIFLLFSVILGNFMLALGTASIIEFYLANCIWNAFIGIISISSFDFND